MVDAHLRNALVDSPSVSSDDDRARHEPERDALAIPMPSVAVAPKHAQPTEGPTRTIRRAYLVQRQRRFAEAERLYRGIAPTGRPAVVGVCAFRPTGAVTLTLWWTRSCATRTATDRRASPARSSRRG